LQNKSKDVRGKARGTEQKQEGEQEAPGKRERQRKRARAKFDIDLLYIVKEQRAHHGICQC
jgi:hypothetical protein